MERLRGSLAPGAVPRAGGLPIGPQARSLIAEAFAAAAADLATALLNSTSDPADAIRLLLPLAGYFPKPLPGKSALAVRAHAVQQALASTLRATVCSALANAARNYQPISYQDAQSVRLLVCDALDAEATRCADEGRDASYQALRTLRAAVALDLAVRGANLAVLVQVTTFVSMPSLAEAFALYQDTSREPELVASADPPHPLFLPLEFNALAR